MLEGAFQVFDRRLRPDIAVPIGVAFSGGGDSLLTLKTACAWAARHERPVIAFHVDHRLQAGGGAWARTARAASARLGARFIELSWDGD